MRVEYIPVTRTAKIALPSALLEKLPGHIALFLPAQWTNQIDAVREQLVGAGKEVELYKARHTSRPGQILGCSIQTWDEVDAFLYIGEGEFHPRAILFKNAQPVFRYDPLRETWDVFSRDEIERIMKQHKGAMIAFLHANIIGVLTTTKAGQKDMKAIELLREKYPKKEFVHFLVNSIDWNGLNDFPFVECWVNTGCPRIGLDDQNKVDKAILNAEHVLEGEHSF